MGFSVLPRVIRMQTHSKDPSFSAEGPGLPGRGAEEIRPVAQSWTLATQKMKRSRVNKRNDGFPTPGPAESTVCFGGTQLSPRDLRGHKQPTAAGHGLGQAGDWGVR